MIKDLTYYLVSIPPIKQFYMVRCINNRLRGILQSKESSDVYSIMYLNFDLHMSRDVKKRLIQKAYPEISGGYGSMVELTEQGVTQVTEEEMMKKF